jgi:hypothetical protein
VKKLLLAAGILLAGCSAPSVGGQEPESDKVFVCKYVRKPGDDGFELLQTGQNPISVSISALVGAGVVVNIGDEFEDAQGKSVVIAFDIGQPEPDISECPGFVAETTTTAATTTSTSPPPPPPPPSTTTTTVAPPPPSPEQTTTTTTAVTTTTTPVAPPPPTTAPLPPTL